MKWLRKLVDKVELPEPYSEDTIPGHQAKQISRERLKTTLAKNAEVAQTAGGLHDLNHRNHYIERLYVAYGIGEKK